MPLDAFCLRAVTQELSAAVTGARIDKVQQPARDQVVLQLRGGLKLLLHAEGNQPRIHLTRLQRENPAQPPMFCMLLRKHLQGGRIAAVTQPGLERVVRLDVEVINELGQECLRSLVLECMGRHANLILLDESEHIIDCLRRVDFEMSQQRQVLPGLCYHLPPGQVKQDPLACDREMLRQLLRQAPGEKPLDSWLLDTFFGFSPLIARELVYRVSGSTDTPAGALTVEREEALLSLIEEVISGEGKPVLLLREGKVADFSYMPIHQYGESVTLETEESFSGLLDRFFEIRERQQRIQQRGQDLLKTVRNAKERITRKLLLQEKEYAATQDREQLRIEGDLITANFYRMEKGQRLLKTENYYDEACAEIEIALDPLLTPQQNAAKYYKQYSKAKTAEKYLTEQMEIARQERDWLESVLQELQQAETEQDFLDIRHELQQAGYLKAGKEKKQPKRHSGPREFRSSAGLRILVGRNNEQNDRLTLKEADKRDIWFHTQKIHGSHVILCTAGQEPDKQSLTEAAMLAAYYSQGRESTQVAVDYTPVKAVKKPAGARPGMVIYHTYQTAYVTPDEALVKQLAVKK